MTYEQTERLLRKLAEEWDHDFTSELDGWASALARIPVETARAVFATLDARPTSVSFLARCQAHLRAQAADQGRRECGLCLDTGFVTVDDAGHGTVRPCTCHPGYATWAKGGWLPQVRDRGPKVEVDPDRMKALLAEARQAIGRGVLT